MTAVTLEVLGMSVLAAALIIPPPRKPMKHSLDYRDQRPGLSVGLLKSIAWVVTILAVCFVCAAAWAGETHGKPAGGDVTQSQAQEQAQGQSQDTSQSMRSTNLSLLLSTPMSTAECVKVYGALVANIPWTDKDCVKMAMYHTLREAGLEEPAYQVLCSTRVMRGIYGSSEVCLLTLMRSHINMCSERQQRIEQFALEACEK